MDHQYNNQNREKQYEKIIISSILSCIALPAFAGTANITGWYADASPSVGHSCFTVSNTSGVPADVTVHLYNQNGEEYTEKLSSTIYITAVGETYTLPALATSRFCTPPTSQGGLGFGTIEAHAASGYQGQVKVVANGWYHNNAVGFSIPVNNGQPF